MTRHLVAPVVATLTLLALATSATAQETPVTPLDATELAVGGVTNALIPRTGGTGVVSASVTNGPTGATASNVILTYVLPFGTTFEPAALGATPGCQPDVVAGQVVCNLGTLAPGAAAKVGVGVRAGEGGAGTLEGWFLPPRSDQYDPSAGELAAQSWNHEADGQGVSVQICWPVEAASIRLTGCNGTPNPEPLSPDATAIQDAFPGPFSAFVTRSWEWRARIRPSLSGPHRVCAAGIDDGGYVAIAPAGQPFAASNVALDVVSFGQLSEGAIELKEQTDYDVLIRVVNRGAVGADNGGSGLGGWGYVGVVSATSPCSTAATQAFGTAGASLVRRLPGSVQLAPTATVAISGTVTDGLGRWSQARVVNLGPDVATVQASVTGEVGPVAPVVLDVLGAAVLQSDLVPGTVGVLGQDPWTISSNDTLPPQL